MQSTATEIQQIKRLQTQNLKANLDASVQEQQGFLTAAYTTSFLTKMNACHPAILAKVADQVVGYALVASPEIRGHHDLLDDLFDHCDEVIYNGTQLSDISYVVVGQLCVAKNFRGQGIVEGLYQQFRNTMEASYQCCITDVDRNNPRSLKAHLKSGFEIVGELDYGGARWDLVLWNWNL